MMSNSCCKILFVKINQLIRILHDPIQIQALIRAAKYDEERNKQWKNYYLIIIINKTIYKQLYRI